MVNTIWILLFLSYYALLFLFFKPFFSLKKTSGYIIETLLKHYRTGNIEHTLFYDQNQGYNSGLWFDNILLGERCDFKYNRNEGPIYIQKKLEKAISFKSAYCPLSIMNDFNFG
jgi:hypothetical protein